MEMENSITVFIINTKNTNYFREVNLNKKILEKK